MRRGRGAMFGINLFPFQDRPVRKQRLPMRTLQGI
jgi:hypothetical protein